MMSKKSGNFSRKNLKNKPVLLVDFDETLIDTFRLKADLQNLITEAKLTPAALAEVDRAFKPFRKEHYMAMKKSAHRGVRELRQAYSSLLKRPGRYNFLGMKKFLAVLHKEYTLILFTYGHAPIQRKKMRQAGVEKYFQKAIFTAGRSKEKELRALSRRYPEAIVLDDEDYVCFAARKLGLVAIQIKKGDKDEHYYQKILNRLM